MCRILFKFHLVPLVLVELFVYRKYGKNRLKWWQTRTHEASGHDRRPVAHLVAPPGPTRAPPGPPSGPYHVINPWELLLSQSQASIQVDLINRQDLMPVDQWAYYHKLGGFHRLTNWPTIWISPCVVQVTAIGSQPSWLDQEAVDPRDGRFPPCAARRPRVATDLSAVYKYPPCLYTINRGCGARWKGPHSIPSSPSFS